jgi:hypothetical protein
MRYQDAFQGSIDEFGEFVKRAIPDLFRGNLVVEGQVVEVPADADVDYKVKYDDDPEGGSITIKASWEKEIEEEAQDD